MALHVKAIRELVQVQQAATSAIEKYKKMLASQLWNAGLVRGVFSMQTLTGTMIGFAAARKPDDAAPEAARGA
eukprot:11285584-Heterocapsa_arctica.AAC.1